MRRDVLPQPLQVTLKTAVGDDHGICPECARRAVYGCLHAGTARIFHDEELPAGTQYDFAAAAFDRQRQSRQQLVRSAILPIEACAQVTHRLENELLPIDFGSHKRGALPAQPFDEARAVVGNRPSLRWLGLSFRIAMDRATQRIRRRGNIGVGNVNDTA